MVRPDVAMTGEVTLRGVVLPVGGIKEKIIAAHRGGMRTIILPKKNEKDLRDLPANVLAEMNFTLVEEVGEVLQAALLPPVIAESSAEGEGSADGKGSGHGPTHRPKEGEGGEPLPAPMPAAMRSSCVSRGASMAKGESMSRRASMRRSVAMGGQIIANARKVAAESGRREAVLLASTRRRCGGSWREAE